MEFFSMLFIFLISSLLMNCIRCEIQAEINCNVKENSQVNTQIADIARDAGYYEQYGDTIDGFKFSINTQNKDYFFLDTDSGRLSIFNTIDRDEICPGKMFCSIELDVIVLKPDNKVDMVKVKITVIDENDNTPNFVDPIFNLSILESTTPGVTFSLPLAIDPDSGINGIMSYSLQELSEKFELIVEKDNLDIIEVKLSLLASLDREQTDNYNLNVIAKDGGSPPQEGILKVFVTVLDANDNNPKFSKNRFYATVAEDTPILSEILEAKAFDLDTGLNGQILYSWDRITSSEYGNIFKVNNLTGVITLMQPLDYEKVKFYELTLVASDRGFGVPDKAKIYVNITDVNDFKPTIEVKSVFAKSGKIEVSENAEIGSFVASVNVYDGDSGIAGQVECNLNVSPFRLEFLSKGVFSISTTKILDREEINQYFLTLKCSDRGIPSLSSFQDITINVLDENDNAPVFINSQYNVTLLENCTIGTSVCQVTASDLDFGDNSHIIYTLSTDSDDRLQIDPLSGIIYTVSQIDFEERKFLLAVAIAKDEGSTQLSATSKINVAISDINDNPPVFQKGFYDYECLENITAGTIIGTINAHDADSHPFDQVVFSITGREIISNTFYIDAIRGQISTVSTLNREFKSVYNFFVVASNKGYPSVSNRVKVSIVVLDVNDNAPQFIFPSKTNFSFQIPGNAPNGYICTTVVATDSDAGPNARLIYSFAREVQENIFLINPITGEVTLNMDVSRTALNTHFSLMIMVSDSGNPVKTAVAILEGVLNKSLIVQLQKEHNYFRSHGGEVLSLSKSHTILISLAMVTLLLVTILIVAIVLVRRRQTKLEDGLPNNQSVLVPDLANYSSDKLKDSNHLNDLNHSIARSYDSLNSSNHKSSFDLNPDFKVDYELNLSQLNYDCPKSTYVTMQKNLDEGDEYKEKDLKYNNNSFTGMSPPQTKISHCTNSHPSLKRPRGSDNPVDVSFKPWNATQKDMAVHKLVQRMTDGNYVDDSDSTSACSTDVSNTDSGKGLSEDNETVHNRLNMSNLGKDNSSHTHMIQELNDRNKQRHGLNNNIYSEILPMRHLKPKSHNSRPKLKNLQTFNPSVQTLPKNQLYSNIENALNSNDKFADYSPKTRQSISLMEVNRIIETHEDSDGGSSTSGSYILEDGELKKVNNIYQMKNHTGSFV